MDKAKDWETDMLGYGDALKAIAARHSDADILELDAGRRPPFTLKEIASTIRSNLAAERNWIRLSGYAYIKAYK